MLDGEVYGHVRSGWIDPEGTFHDVASMDHEMFMLRNTPHRTYAAAVRAGWVKVTQTQRELSLFLDEFGHVDGKAMSKVRSILREYVRGTDSPTIVLNYIGVFTDILSFNAYLRHAQAA